MIDVSKTVIKITYEGKEFPLATGTGDLGAYIDGTITTINSATIGSATSIRGNAFNGLAITTVEIPSTVTSIGESAFANNQIGELTLEEGLQIIGFSAFENNNITTLTIPDSVTRIGESAFAGNPLKEITVVGDTPPYLGLTVFPDTVEKINVSYNGYENYIADERWSAYADKFVRGLAIPSTITVTVNNYLGELVNGASVTISGNGQTYTGTTDTVGIFSQGDLQPATYTISVADLEGFKTPETQEVVVEQDTQNSVVFTYVEMPLGYGVFGVSWVNDTTTTMERTDDAVGMTYSINSDGTVQSDFDNVFPWNESTIVTDEKGNKFLRMPKMYFRVGTENGAITSVAVSNERGVDGNWHEVESFDFGIYGGSLSNNALCSVSGVGRANNYTMPQFGTYARANSTTEYLYFQRDLKHTWVMICLWWIEFATKNQKSLFKGRYKESGTLGGTDPCPTGGTDGLTTPTGYDVTTNQMRWHYIEDFVGNYTEMIDGIIAQQTTVYVSDDPTKYSSGTSYWSRSKITPVSESGCALSYGWDDTQPFLCLPTYKIDDSSYSKGFCCAAYRAGGTENNWYNIATGVYNYTTVGSYGWYGITTFDNGLRDSLKKTTRGARLLRKAKT